MAEARCIPPTRFPSRPRAARHTRATGRTTRAGCLTIARYNSPRGCTLLGAGWHRCSRRILGRRSRTRGSAPARALRASAKHQYGADPDWERELIGRRGTDAASEGWRDVLGALEQELPGSFPHGHDADTRLARCIWAGVRATHAGSASSRRASRAALAHASPSRRSKRTHGLLSRSDLPPVLTGNGRQRRRSGAGASAGPVDSIRGSGRDGAFFTPALREVGGVDVFVLHRDGLKSQLSSSRASRGGRWRGRGLARRERHQPRRRFPRVPCFRVATDVIVAESGAKRSWAAGRSTASSPSSRRAPLRRAALTRFLPQHRSALYGSLRLRRGRDPGASQRVEARAVGGSRPPSPLPPPACARCVGSALEAARRLGRR